MVTLSHPGRAVEARGVERKWAGPGRVGEARGDEAGAGLTRARRDRARRDEADPVHLRAPERGDAVP